ncbi:hypothetical protein J7355_08365 [Endozoicomonas sp. G2_2]|uniref:hypothetical protein n=1 Tax=Gammaproteobacteria TaxID=1236 RepID=UPI000C434D71|nr:MULTISPECIES: hypothetical protein [Gammaproteobacteria]MAS10442.1 hypothetical protein [Salinisphaera sp.]MBO9470112.1 hypothetical protein [Endozoicomonas sp. G2_2]|tara:strand:+ start:694 stop:1206 length:513 start_codon:yes stop_codon:yes gene_type:complete
MKNTESARALDPEKLDPEALDPKTYHRVIGPALKAAADIAAKRGHPTLHDDMPAMLALVDMVTRLTDLFIEHYPKAARDEPMLENAATGACVMVFQQAKMPADAIGQCLAALETAYRQLYEHDVIDDARPFIAMAWEHLDDDQRDEAAQCLQQASERVIAAIEAWQTQVH